MAAGDNKQFRDYALKEGQGVYDNSSDSIAIAFISDAYSTVDVNATNPKLADYTVSSGGNILAVNTLSSVTWSRSAGVTTLDAADLATFSKDASNPTDVKCALVYNNTSASDDAYCVYDLTADGTTSLDLVNSDFTFSFGASGILTATVA